MNPPSTPLTPATEPTAHHVDVLILGGGINGTGIARDAVGRGLSVLLCERGDLASGTSQASSKLIHGGLRYLEYGEFRLVREALAEREALLSIAPHIIKPLTFCLPWAKHLRPRWLIRLGLFLYDHLSKRQSLAGSHYGPLPIPNSLKSEFGKGFQYSDCWVDDARLVVCNALDAQERGATILTHTVCTKISRHRDHWQATLQGPNDTQTIIAKALINATGPWVDETHRALLPDLYLPGLQKIQGSHLIFRKWYSGDQAYILQHTDQRIVFVLPFEQEYCLVGTTDTPLTGSADQASLLATEADYLCQVVNRYFQQTLKPEEALWHYSGVRALVAQTGKKAAAISRDYHIECDGQNTAPLLTIMGGKITTYRQLANHTLDKLAAYLPMDRSSWTEHHALPGGDLLGLAWPDFYAAMRERYAFLSPNIVYRMARAYGSRLTWILQEARDDSSLGLHFGAGLYQVEVDYLRQHEWARCAADIVWRRTKIGLQLSDAQIETLHQYLNHAT